MFGHRKLPPKVQQAAQASQGENTPVKQEELVQGIPNQVLAQQAAVQNVQAQKSSYADGETFQGGGYVGIMQGVYLASTASDYSAHTTQQIHPAGAVPQTIEALSDFCAAMTAKMHLKDSQTGFGDWYDKETYDSHYYSRYLVAQLAKPSPDPVDIANFCMIISYRQEHAEMRHELSQVLFMAEEERRQIQERFNERLAHAADTASACHAAMDKILDAINLYPSTRLPGEVANFFDRLRDTIVQFQQAHGATK